MGTCFDTETHECGGELASSTNWCREGASWMCCRYPAAVSEKPGNGNVNSNSNSAAGQTTDASAVSQDVTPFSSFQPFLPVVSCCGRFLTPVWVEFVLCRRD
jgi:hypothetical protein